MNILNELDNLVNDRFEDKKNEIYQEFRVLVKVSGDTSENIREKLDKTAENLKEVDTVVEVTPN